MNYNDLSIVMPCYNYGAFLAEAIESVSEAARLGAEILVVDDGSEDQSTLQAIRMLPDFVKVIRIEHSGPAAARNAAIRVAKGGFILPIDSDDMANPGFIEEALRLFALHPDIDVVYGDCIFVGEKSGRWHAEVVPKKLIYVNGLNVTAMFKKRVWEANEGYDESMIYGYEDWEFWLHALKNKMKFKKATAPAFYYRIRPKSLVNTTTIPQHQDLLKYMHHKHHDFVLQNYIQVSKELHGLRNDYRQLLNALFRLVVRKMGLGK
jgi:glycosyltransferase involved in cell wall biosynthesis